MRGARGFLTSGPPCFDRDRKGGHLHRQVLSVHRPGFQQRPALLARQRRTCVPGVVRSLDSVVLDVGGAHQFGRAPNMAQLQGLMWPMHAAAQPQADC